MAASGPTMPSTTAEQLSSPLPLSSALLGVMVGECGNGHALRIIKRLALRAGVNCGHCVNKKGLSCSEHPVCRHFVLHKMRKTFASTLHHKGLPAQTLQRYLRHSDLDTTLKYIAVQPDDQVRETINATFSGFGRPAA
jgi:integrase/recombinase XerD